MTVWLWLRAVGLLRRGVRALESLAKSQAEQALIMRQTWDEQHPPERKSKLVEIGYLDVQAANDKWNRAQEAREAGIDLDS